MSLLGYNHFVLYCLLNVKKKRSFDTYQKLLRAVNAIESRKNSLKRCYYKGLQMKTMPNFSIFLSVPSSSLICAIINSCNASREALKVACRVLSPWQHSQTYSSDKTANIQQERLFIWRYVVRVRTHMLSLARTHKNNTCALVSEPVKCRHRKTASDRIYHRNAVCMCVCVRSNVHFNMCQNASEDESTFLHFLVCVQHLHMYICVYLFMRVCVHMVAFNPFL